MEGCHTHSVNPSASRKRKFVKDAKELVESKPDISCQEAYHKALACDFDDLRDEYHIDEFAVAMPLYASLKTSLHRRRAKLPKTRAVLDIEAPWTLDRDGQRFLVIDDGSDQRILGFASEESPQILCQADTIFMGGTFRVVPRIFLQLYTLHAFHCGRMTPCVCNTSCFLTEPQTPTSVCFDSVENTWGR